MFRSKCVRRLRAFVPGLNALTLWMAPVVLTPASNTSSTTLRRRPEFSFRFLPVPVACPKRFCSETVSPPVHANITHVWYVSGDPNAERKLRTKTAFVSETAQKRFPKTVHRWIQQVHFTSPSPPFASNLKGTVLVSFYSWSHTCMYTVDKTMLHLRNPYTADKILKFLFKEGKRVFQRVSTCLKTDMADNLLHLNRQKP